VSFLAVESSGQSYFLRKQLLRHPLKCAICEAIASRLLIGRAGRGGTRLIQGVQKMPTVPSLLSADSLDRIAAYASYYTSAFTFLITALVLVITVLAIRGPLKENTRTRKQELVQKRFENALTLLKIVGGVSDLKVNGKASAELQLSALVALENYPEYHGVFEFLLSFYKSDPTKADYDNPTFVAFADRLVQNTIQKKKRRWI
jgi:hypothetical protein